MVYHEVRKDGAKIHNYLIHNTRQGSKWIKKSKYIGKGKLSEAKIADEKAKFELWLKQQKSYKYLTADNVKSIELIKQKVNNYLKTGASVAEKFKDWFSTEFTYNSNAIEGNTLTLRETSLIINDNITPKGATLREVHEAKNHKDAIDFIESYKGDLSEDLIKKIHKHVLKNIDDSTAGKYRKVQVFIRGSDVTLPPETLLPNLMKELIVWYRKNRNKYHPFELAALVSMKFVTIHPFVDGNGRVSRFIMNFILSRDYYPAINIHIKDRAEYMSAVRKANDKKYSAIIKLLLNTLKKNYYNVGTEQKN